MDSKKNLKIKNRRRCFMIESSDSGSGDDADIQETAAKHTLHIQTIL